jgi:hypothetical protein
MLARRKRGKMEQLRLEFNAAIDETLKNRRTNHKNRFDESKKWTFLMQNFQQLAIVP